MEELPFTNGFYISDSLPLSHQECNNVHVSGIAVPGLSQTQLIGTPGIAETASTGPILQANRGARVKGGFPYFVNGNSLYRLDRAVVDSIESFSITDLGTIEGTGLVSMADNGIQLMILVPGGKGYIYNESLGTPLQEITDSDFNANGSPQIVRYLDGYFACSTDSKKWIISSLNDGFSWGALDFSSAESDPDAIVAPIVVNNQIFILGSETTEGFQNVGVQGLQSFPFQRNNIFLDKGCDAPFTLVNTNSTFFMVGSGKRENSAIWQFAGNNYSKISTKAIETVIQGYTPEELQQSFGWSYSQEGAYFVGFSFPDRSFVYELITKVWHERTSIISEQISKWRVGAIVSAYGRLFCGDIKDGRIGEIDLSVYTEYDNNIIRVFSTQPFFDKGNELTSTIFELTMESGVGDANTPDPVVSLSMSKDGKTFGPERVRKIGRIGEYGKRIIWRKNGRFSRFVVLRFRLSDPVKPVFIKLEYE